MTMHVLVDNIGFLSEQHLTRGDLPARYLWRLWRLLENRGTCLQAWKVLSKLLLIEDGEKTLGLYKYRHHICRPSEPLSHYTKPLESPSFDFLSYLNISGPCSFDSIELMALPELKNLAVLEIIQPADELRTVFPRISDRLVRGWSEKHDPFPLLRILRVWGDESVTEHSLQYLSQFPSLLLYDVNGSRSDWGNAETVASLHGWETAEPLHGPRDSLLWYLILFKPLDEDQPGMLRDLARSIDEGLINFCQNNNQPLSFVPSETAPPFLDYLNDAARSNLPLYIDSPSSYNAQSCKGYPFETWAFFLNSFLGQLTKDEDLKKNRAGVTKQAVSGSLTLPSRPLACLQLGHCGRSGISPTVSYVRRGLFATSRYTFYKKGIPGGNIPNATIPKSKEVSASMKPQPQLSSVETGLTLNRQKRRRIDDLLRSFTRS
ncbi:hypothetical protein SODALDRAFT_336363 [Sodiomyces alkalinus F11]|uniref:Cbs domain-containing protein n=1 Tax=Sodiomyces alkalinus (strain CBS 110278 / VKM F-3762 / F11) TaxID=1314773 RepID=A0A3N2Q7I5_SODAK|nr:hypothetical protein SODALDRAFT_336363 [Sodiomyces alkalinus F11]ROT42739.1 hypothetical protein SODALDRAFT_336363 [Sodiomyces alkalinus F11]